MTARTVQREIERLEAIGRTRALTDTESGFLAKMIATEHKHRRRTRCEMGAA